MRAARGERIRGVHADWDTPAGRRSILVWAEAVPLPGAGDVVVLTFEDVTELEAARRRTALLAEAGARLGRSLDPDEVATAVAELAVPTYADWAFVELVQARSEHRPPGDRLRRPLEGCPGRVVRPDVSARPGLRGRLAAGDPDRRAGADPRDPGGVPDAGRAGSAPARAAAQHRLPLVDGRAAARPRPRDRRPGARDRRVRAHLRGGGPPGRTGAGRPLRARARQRPPLHRAARRRAGRAARRRGGQHDPRRRRGRRHRPAARRHARLRQRRGGPVDRLRLPGRAAGRADHAARGPLRDARRARRPSGGRAPARAPGAARGEPRAADRPQPAARRARDALDAREGDAGPCAGRERPARDQRDRGHHGAQARRARPAVPRRGRPRAVQLTRPRGDAGGGRAAGGPGHRRLVRRRRARRR